jgi:hypothetical protein
MKLKINPKLYLYGSVSLAIVLTVLASITNPCNFPNHGWLSAVLLIMFVVSCFKWLPYAKNDYLWLFSMVIYTVIFLYLSTKAESRNIERESIVVSARIIHISTPQRTGPSIEYVYLNDSIGGTSSFVPVNIEVIRNRKVTIGDTILIRFAVSCPQQSRIFRLSPTREEVEKFRNGVFYRDFIREER